MAEDIVVCRKELGGGYEGGMPEYTIASCYSCGLVERYDDDKVLVQCDFEEGYTDDVSKRIFIGKSTDSEIEPTTKGLEHFPHFDSMEMYLTVKKSKKLDAFSVYMNGSLFEQPIRNFVTIEAFQDANRDEIQKELKTLLKEFF
jgi:hypothetical protein